MIKSAFLNGGRYRRPVDVQTMSGGGGDWSKATEKKRQDANDGRSSVIHYRRVLSF